MAVLVSAFVFLALTGHSSAVWCVCKEGLGDAMLQKTIDYACGAGADCGPTHQNGPCFNPNTIKAHCSYAANSYFQRKGQAAGTCDFSGTATLSSSDPSYPGCTYPKSTSAAGTTTTTPTTAGGTPYSGMPSTGAIGGAGNGGISPPGAGGINPDYTDPSVGFRLRKPGSFYTFLVFTLLVPLLLWG